MPKNITLTPHSREIILAFADSNMNLAAVARQVFMSRGGVRYHFDKIKERTGLDPGDFYDLIELVKLVEAYEEGAVPVG